MAERRNTILSLTAAASLFSLCAPVNAQLEQIVVTATRRAQNSQNIPITLQAASGSELQARGADTAEDILFLFSNLSVNGSNEVNKGFTIRGVGTNNFHGNVNRAVGIYRDDVSMSTPFSGVLGIYDVARVEVLRGPQNTLFGRNTTGGAIHFISNAPAIEGGHHNYLVGTVGENSQFDAEGGLGFGLSKRSAARFSFQSVTRNGLFVNQAPGREGERLGKRDRQSARLQVLWQPTASTSVLLNAHGGYDRGLNIGNKAIGLRNTDNAGIPCDAVEIIRGSDYQTRNDCAASNGFNPSSQDWATVHNVTGAQAKIDIEGGFIKLVHEFPGGYDLTSLTAYERTRVNQVDDTGGYNEIRLAPTQDGDFRQYSQELRLASAARERLRWLAGLYYFDEDMLLGTHVVNGAAGVIASNILDQNDTDLSVYGQVEYDWSDRVTLGIGLRHTNNRKSAPSSVFRALPRGPNGLTDPTQLLTNEIITSAPVVARRLDFTDLEANLNEIGGKADVSIRPTDAVMVYASYSRGFKAGGFDTRALVALTPGADPRRPVLPEFLSAWETGIKTTLANGTLLMNAAVFSYRWEDLQTFVVVGGVPGFANIPESELSGLEVEATWAAGDNWLFAGSVGLLQTEVTDVGDLADSVDAGHELTNAPGFSANVSISREFDLASGSVTLRADYAHSGKQKDTLLFANDPFSTKARTNFLNARATYEFGAHGQYQLALWAENLTRQQTCFDIGLVDDPFVTAGQLSSTGACSPNAGRRRLGLSAQLSF